MKQESQMMPPPGGKQPAPAKKKRPKDWPANTPLISGPTLIHHTHSTSFSMAGPLHQVQHQNQEDQDKDSDSEYGFGNGWQN